MKLIKKAQEPEPKANQFVTVGDLIAYQAPANHDGRGGWDVPPPREMAVKKVNKFTFDAEDTKGNLYRLDIREDKFQVKL
jgi:hypothetical protein